MLTVAERIDPENALFPTLQLAEMADACTKKVDSAESESTPSISPVLRKHYAITDMTKHQAAMDLFYTIVKMPRLESHTARIAKTAPATHSAGRAGLADAVDAAGVS